MPDSLYFPTLEINRPAIARNYGVIRSHLSKSAKAGAVVKANAYGLGATQIAPTLYDAGCHDFFVATLAEGIELRAVLPQATIYVFHGARKGQAVDFLAHQLIPVLNSTEQVKNWAGQGAWALHIDTGMSRLGIDPEEAEAVSKTGKPCLILSHLACASDEAHPMNKHQLELLCTTLRYFPGIPVSFANSSGVMLGEEYQFDLVRPGRALYGITRGANTPADMENVVTLSAPVLQYRTTPRAQPVGYGATVTAEKGTVLATVELGYADGFLRTLSNKTYGWAGGVKVPLMGIVSMDMVIMDVTHVPAHLRNEELRIVFIGKEQPIDTVAQAAETIGYEIFTRLGSRVKRVYT